MLKLVLPKERVATESLDKYGKPCLLHTWQLTPEVTYTLKSRYDKGRIVRNGRTVAVACLCGSNVEGRHAGFKDSAKTRLEALGLKLEPYVY